MTKLRIDFNSGLLEVEGEEEFVKAVYADFSDKVALSFEATQGSNHPVKSEEKQDTNGKQDISDQSGAAPKQAKSRKRYKESYSIVKDLDLSAKDKEKSLRDFYAEKAPSSAMEANTVFVYYLSRIANIEAVTVNHVYTCYRDVSRAVPSLRQSLLDTASRRGWIDTSSMDNIDVTRPGENFILHDLPHSQASK